jgi:hypothetical protein
MMGRRYFEGAIPGKKVKKKENDEEKRQEYEKHRKDSSVRNGGRVVHGYN